MERMLEIYQGAWEGYIFESWWIAPEDEPDLKYWMAKVLELDLTELKRKDLACFCKIGEPCHADLLLKLANQ